MTFLPELLSKLGDFHQILFGLALVAIVVALPNGLVGTLSVLWANRVAQKVGHGR